MLSLSLIIRGIKTGSDYDEIRHISGVFRIHSFAPINLLIGLAFAWVYFWNFCEIFSTRKFMYLKCLGIKSIWKVFQTSSAANTQIFGANYFQKVDMLTISELE